MELTEEIFQKYFENLLSGKRAACESIITTLAGQGVDIRDIYEGLFKRSLYQVGELWERNKISVAVEHMATAITESLLGLLYPQIFATPRKNHRAIIACAANEYHQLGGKIVADVLEFNGWDSYFLGANTPTGDLIRLIDEKEPQVLCLSLAVYTSLSNLLSAVKLVRSSYCDLPIFVGGQAFRWGGVDAVLETPDTYYLENLNQLEDNIIKQFD